MCRNMIRSMLVVRWWLAALVLGFAGDALAAQNTKGWFACDGCGPARLKAEGIGPTNRECSQRCIAEGANLTFIDQRTRTILQVANPEAGRGRERHSIMLR